MYNTALGLENMENTLNRLRTRYGRTNYMLCKWGLTLTYTYIHPRIQTYTYIMYTCLSGTDHKLHYRNELNPWVNFPGNLGEIYIRIN